MERRLVEIGENLEKSGKALGLLSLGSVGIETTRLDEWSDIDFFAIVKQGVKQDFLEETSWLDTKTSPIVYKFRNTADGFKLLWKDGVFGEMAIFEPHELDTIPYAPGRFIWAGEGLDHGVAIPKKQGQAPWVPDSAEWAANELITCLYVGMCRYRRGEKISAWRFIQTLCFDRFQEIIALTETPHAGVYQDFYSRDRRWEFLYPDLAGWTSSFLAGVERTPEAALAYLEFLETRNLSHPSMAEEIRKLSLL